MTYLKSMPRTLLLGGLLIIMNHTVWAEPTRPTVSYNKATDKLSVTANDASYTETMGYIATASGIEILMDPKAEHHITTSLKDMPLEKALKELSRETSFVFLYADAKPNKDKTIPAKPVLTGMHVLPKGQTGNNNNLVPILGPAGEAFIREKNRTANPGPNQNQKLEIFDYAQQRWEARLKAMPAEQRKQLLAGAQKKLDALEQHQTEQKQRQEAHAEKRKSREQERQARLEALKTSDPETYELRKQRIEARHQRTPAIQP